MVFDTLNNCNTCGQSCLCHNDLDSFLRISATLELHHYAECGATQFSCLSLSIAVIFAVKYEKFMSHKSASSQPTNKEVILVTCGLTFHT